MLPHMAFCHLNSLVCIIAEICQLWLTWTLIMCQTTHLSRITRNHRPFWVYEKCYTTTLISYLFTELSDLRYSLGHNQKNLNQKVLMTRAFDFEKGMAKPTFDFGGMDASPAFDLGKGNGCSPAFILVWVGGCQPSTWFEWGEMDAAQHIIWRVVR